MLDLQPWSNARSDSGAIGEIWYERPGRAPTEPSLLLKILFTNQPLSIQVHPDDAFAQSIGLPNGKSEAWYILAAAPEAEVALGLDRRLTPQQLREAVDDGSIADRVVWRAVSAGEAIFVPAGTIHAIGKGLVIAEIQQRSDATFRLFDYGRQRELHIESAVAVANAGPAALQALPDRLANDRTLLVSSPHFVLERINLMPNAAWRLEAKRETWLLAVDGGARVGAFDLGIGDAVFVQSDCVDVHAGSTGMVCLAAYTGGDIVANLLERIRPAAATSAGLPQALKVPTFLPHAMEASPANRRPGAFR
jgi:mannose-6-phosphate isomerase